MHPSGILCRSPCWWVPIDVSVPHGIHDHGVEGGLVGCTLTNVEINDDKKSTSFVGLLLSCSAVLSVHWRFHKKKCGTTLN